MALHVYNTLTRRRERFVPAHPRVVRLYACGLTVYAPMHIGHARTYCFWDFFRRYLEHRGFHVLAIINYTDIDDRILAQAGDGEGPIDVAERVIATFRRDCRLLRIKDYAAYTRATDFVTEQIELASELLERGHAYTVEGEVLYDVASFPGYGKLSGKKVEELLAGASGRVEEDAARKRHPADFALWKPAVEGQPRWETGRAEWPSGRPGWHLECSAMSTALLGRQFDVHGGAIDNLFPHHENELAQSEPVCGAPWVRYWMHPEHLDLAGVKMSKSLGNVIGVPEILQRHRYDEVRWFFAMHHYRMKLPFSDELVDSSAEGYARILRLVRILEEKLGDVPDSALQIPVAGLYASQRPGEDQVPRRRHRYTHGRFGEITARFLDRFIAALDDDLNSPRATAALFDYVHELYVAGIEASDDVPSLLAAYQALVRHLYVLGCEHVNERLYPELAADCFPVGGAAERPRSDAVIERLLAIRQEARREKDFAQADRIRELLGQAGVVIEDTPQGQRWWME